jgi:hypothetical protein
LTHHRYYGKRYNQRSQNCEVNTPLPH